MNAPIRPAAPRLFLVLFAVLALALSLALARRAFAEGPPPIVGKCREDLARRLSLPAGEVKLAWTSKVVFPDASLGLSRPEEVYAQVETPGLAVILEAARKTYLYTATDRAFRYGGPTDAWTCSTLAIHAVAQEPNLNGDLVQTSLVGTNPRTLLEGVSDFQPQENGSVLAIRRTSRSGHELLYLAPEGSKPTLLMASFAFVSPTLDGSGKRWAAFVRPMVGGPWLLVRNDLGAGPDQARQVELPAGARPANLYWQGQNPVIEVIVDGKTRRFEQVADEGPETWREPAQFVPPHALDMSLNKSEHLEVRAAPEGGATQVARVWFTGDEKILATIPGFEVKEFAISPAQAFAVLSGRSGDATRAFTVDLFTGEVLPLPSGFQGETRLFLAHPEGFQRLQGWIRP